MMDCENKTDLGNVNIILGEGGGERELEIERGNLQYLK